MSEPPMLPLPPSPAPARPRPPAALLAVLLAVAGCHGDRGARDPEARRGAELVAAGWIDDALLGPATAIDPERLALLAGAGVEGRILRLDRLLDLYDAARFAGDDAAREALWLALGGHPTTRGIEASREVVLRLLDEAYAIEELGARAPLGDDRQRFVADAIMLLSTDLFLPDSAEALISQTLAYRMLAEGGHPRLADNAHWRVYDHVRAVLAGTTEVGPSVRPDIAVHALYATTEDITAWLDERAPHARPPLPSAEQLWALLDGHRQALAQLPRWQGVLAARADDDAQLRETVAVLLPQPRDPSWPLAQLPRGTAVRESLAPVVLLVDGQRVLAPTGPAPQRFAADDRSDPAQAAIESLLIADGRGLVLLAADAAAPAPDFAATLASLAAARVGAIELAVHEPRIPGTGADSSPDAGALVDAPVVLALPLQVVRADDLGPGARAFAAARVHVRLTGRGPRFAVDGRWLGAAPALPSDVARLAADLRRAYPGERAVAVSLADDVQPAQLVDLLATLIGGRDPLFLAAGWLVGPPTLDAPDTAPNTKADAIVAARLALVDAPLQITLDPASLAQLSDDDRVRLDQASARLRGCVPELEAPLTKAGLTVTLEFAASKLIAVDASRHKLGDAADQRFEACARERLLGLQVTGVGAGAGAEPGSFAGTLVWRVL